MRKFILLIPSVEGDFEFAYSKDNGLILGFNFNAVLSDKQHDYLLSILPLTIKDVLNLPKVIEKGSSITEVKIEITFQMFWDKYFAGRQKDSSSRKRTETKWNRMAKTEQTKAFNYIHKYISSLPTGINAKYAETYLNAELWNN